MAFSLLVRASCIPISRRTINLRSMTVLRQLLTPRFPHPSPYGPASPLVSPMLWAQEDFVHLFPLYLQSHFNLAFELLVVLIVYASFANSGYFLETFSVYLLCIGLLYTPLLFNPNGLDFTYARWVLCPCSSRLLSAAAFRM